MLISFNGRAFEEPGGAQLRQVTVFLGFLGERRPGSYALALVRRALVTFGLFILPVGLHLLFLIQSLHNVIGRGLTAREGQLLFIYWNRTAHKEGGDVVGEALVKALLPQPPTHLGAHLAEVQVVVEFLHICMVADVAANRRVA